MKKKEKVSKKEIKEKKLKEKNRKKNLIVEDEEEKERKSFFTLRNFMLVIFLLLVICLLCARYVSTTGLKVKEYAITSKELPNGFDGLKLVQFSDLHYGSTVGISELKNIVKKINDLNPDIVIFTGDLVDNGVILKDGEEEKIIKQLNKIDSTLGTYAVRGNHDYDHEYWDEIIPQLNWTVLDNTYKYIYYNDTTPIVLVGLDDYLEGTKDYENSFSYLNENDNSLYTIVLLHEPDQIDEISDYDFNLAFAGHSHLGQVRIPLLGAVWTPEGSKKYYDEQYKVGNADLYISGGIGTSALKLRFMNRPSISLFRFYTH